MCKRACKMCKRVCTICKVLGTMVVEIVMVLWFVYSGIVDVSGAVFHRGRDTHTAVPDTHTRTFARAHSHARVCWGGPLPPLTEADCRVLRGSCLCPHRPCLTSGSSSELGTAHCTLSAH